MKEALYLPAAVILRRPFLLVPHLVTFAEVRDGVAGHTDLARSAEMNRLRMSVAAACQNLRAHARKGRGSARQRRKTSRVSSGRKREFTATKDRLFFVVVFYSRRHALRPAYCGWNPAICAPIFTNPVPECAVQTPDSPGAMCYWGIKKFLHASRHKLMFDQVIDT